MATAAIGFAAPTFLRRTLRALTVPQVASFNNHPIFHSHSLPLTISPSFYSGICHVVHAFKGNANDVLLKGVADKNTVEAVKHILEMGYKNIMENCMENANVLKESLEKMGRFEIQAGYQPRLLTLQPLWMK